MLRRRMPWSRSPLSPLSLRLAASALLATCGLLGSAPTAPGQDDSAEPAQWAELFDGKSIEGWVKRGGDATYSIEDGAIVGHSRKGTPNTFLCTPRNYTNFELELEVFVHPKLNSGIQIRSNSLPDYKSGQVHGYQVEIDPSERAWSGGIYDEGRRGWLFDLQEKPEARAAFKQDQWNHYRIRCHGDSIQTWINGVPAADLQDNMTAEGFIALQVHSTDQDEPMTVKWRNIKIRELP